MFINRVDPKKTEEPEQCVKSCEHYSSNNVCVKDCTNQKRYEEKKLCVKNCREQSAFYDENGGLCI